tara:strand:- start:375 stop:611 length:237 start_codon:yes stop_codon:yes gene_type:complete
MSYDQKPARIKLVSNGGSAQLPGNAIASASEQPLETADSVAVTDAETGRGWSMISVVLFIVGSAIGGAALAALPHLAG